MGFRGSWAVVKDVDMDAALNSIGLARTGEIDFLGESQILCAQLPRSVVLMGDFNFITPERLRLISAHGEIVGCKAYETVMESAAFGFREGRQVWGVSHSSEIARDNLEVAGSPPVQLAAIREHIERQIAAADGVNVDYTFDVPIELMKSFCGFRPDHGDPLPLETVCYMVEPIQAGARGVRQARMRERHEAFTSIVETDLFAAAEALGFERLVHHPAFQEFYPLGAASVFIRLRGELSEAIQFKWAFDSGAPYIRTDFFVRKEAEPREGTAGWVEVHGPKPKFWEQLLGREGDPEAALRAIDAARHALGELDEHLRTGKVGPHIVPAFYADSIS